MQRVALAFLLVTGCGRTEAPRACETYGPVRVLTTSFEASDAPVALSGNCVSEFSGNSRTGTSQLRCLNNNTGGTATTTTPVAVTSNRVAVGFYLENNLSNSWIAVRLSVDGGESFIESTDPVPSLRTERIGELWTYTRVRFDLTEPSNSVLAQLSLESEPGATGGFSMWVDDLEIIDMKVCGAPPGGNQDVPPVSPAGMVWIPPTDTIGAYFIDRYEAHVDVISGLGNANQSSAPDSNDGSTVARALSDPDVLPQIRISWYQARVACMNVGKRLCTSIEFERACAGDDGLLYPYGNTYTPNECQTEDNFENPTGSANNCGGPFGVFDLVGNLSELIDGGAELLAGGSWVHIDEATCRFRSGISPFNNSADDVGFRCCRNAD